MISLFSIANAASGAQSIVNSILPGILDNIIMPLIKLLWAASLLIFAWGLIGLFRNGDDSSARTTSRNHILAGVIGFFIMISVYGIIRFVANSVGQSAVLPF